MHQQHSYWCWLPVSYRLFKNKISSVVNNPHCMNQSHLLTSFTPVNEFYTPVTWSGLRPITYLTASSLSRTVCKPSSATEYIKSNSVIRSIHLLKNCSLMKKPPSTFAFEIGKLGPTIITLNCFDSVFEQWWIEPSGLNLPINELYIPSNQIRYF